MERGTSDAATRAHDVFLFYEKWILRFNALIFVALAIILHGLNDLGISLVLPTYGFGWQAGWAATLGTPPAIASDVLGAFSALLLLAIVMSAAHLMAAFLVPGLAAQQFAIMKRAMSTTSERSWVILHDGRRSMKARMTKPALSLGGVAVFFVVVLMVTPLGATAFQGQRLIPHNFTFYVLFEAFSVPAMIYLAAKSVVVLIGSAGAGTADEEKG